MSTSGEQPKTGESFTHRELTVTADPERGWVLFNVAGREQQMDRVALGVLIRHLQKLHGVMA